MRIESGALIGEGYFSPGALLVAGVVVVAFRALTHYVVEQRKLTEEQRRLTEELQKKTAVVLDSGSVEDTSVVKTFEVASAVLSTAESDDTGKENEAEGPELSPEGGWVLGPYEKNHPIIEANIVA